MLGTDPEPTPKDEPSYGLTRMAIIPRKAACISLPLTETPQRSDFVLPPDSE